MTLENHFVLDARDCSSGDLDSFPFVGEFVLRLAHTLNLHAESPPILVRSGSELSGQTCVSAWLPSVGSFLSVRTYSEPRFLSLDIVHPDEFPIPSVEALVNDVFTPRSITSRSLERGAEYAHRDIEKPGQTKSGRSLVKGWFYESDHPFQRFVYDFTDILASVRTKYQDVKIFMNPSFGKMLMIDGYVQSADADECVYHEVLVHPAAASRRRLQNALIIGGGEGATARELLRYPDLAQLTMVEIDPVITDLAKTHLSNYHSGAFDDPRLTLIHQDGRDFLASTDTMFDVIVVDATDPEPDVPDAPSDSIYTPEFFMSAKRSLSEDGLLVVQSGATSYVCHAGHLEIFHIAAEIFSSVETASAFIPSFAGEWAFCLATDGRPAADVPPDQIEERISSFADQLKYYDSRCHHSLFVPPKYLWEKYQKQRGMNAGKSCD